MWSAEFPLIGAGGEPVDLRRTFFSHGVAELPPMRVDPDARWFEVTLAIERAGARTLHIEPGRDGFGLITTHGRAPSMRAESRLVAAVRHVLSMDADLSGFYAIAVSDPELAWAARGAGRMIRSPTVFEEVVKTICTTNCAWSATTRMVSALVEHLGDKAPGAPDSGPGGRAFPTPDAMANATEAFYREVVRAGYRGRYLLELSRSLAGGAVDLEALGRATHEELSDDEVEAGLLALPGVGPYAAAHVMMMLGRHSKLILDSWTRPTYAKLVGSKAVKDSTIQRRFKPYGRYAGLAFWLFLTRGWVSES